MTWIKDELSHDRIPKGWEKDTELTKALVVIYGVENALAHHLSCLCSGWVAMERGATWEEYREHIIRKAEKRKNEKK